MMERSIRRLHDRYRIQASWTTLIRNNLYTQIDLAGAKRVLEVGSGTGVISAELTSLSPAQVCGVDIDLQATRLANELDGSTRYSVADGMALPFKHGTFDITLCHFLLLWTSHPAQILREMVRVTSPDGHVLALAEPDYGGRIDYPQALSELGRLQGGALSAQGADPNMGRKIRALFTHAGLRQIHAGVLGGEWACDVDDDALQSEWDTLHADLGGRLSEDAIQHLQHMDAQAWQEGTRILYVPTFYACGRVA